MSKIPTHTERVEGMREELLDYQGFLERLGTPRSLVQITQDHGAQCASNYADSGERIWFERMGLCDDLLHEKNVAPDDRRVA